MRKRFTDSRLYRGLPITDQLEVGDRVTLKFHKDDEFYFVENVRRGKDFQEVLVNGEWHDKRCVSYMPPEDVIMERSRILRDHIHARCLELGIVMR